MHIYIDIIKYLPGFTLKIKFSSRNGVTGLLGASGSGKSMTLRCIAGIETPDKGVIVLNGRIFFDSEKKINLPSRERKVGYLFQNYALFPHMTVEENVGFALEYLPKREKDEIIQEKISMLELQGLEDRYPYQLSGGQQQRVALARALSIDPDILLLDEPFSALDEHLRSILIKQFVDTLHNYNGLTLFVTHNRDEAYRICQDIVVLEEGRVENQGYKGEIFDRPKTLATARLTGCKNFSYAKYISNNSIEATDWGINLKTYNEVMKDIQYVGLRAHHIQFSANDKSDNMVSCWLCDYNESLFGVSVYLTIGNKPMYGENYHIQWEISKEEWSNIKTLPQPWNLHFRPEKLLLLDC